MFKVITPLFNADGAAGGGDNSGSGWGSVATQVAAELTGMSQQEAPADDGQPETDPDAETLETDEDPDLAEGETDEAEHTEDDEETPDDKEPAFTDETEVDLGEGRQPVKLAELKAGYLRQSDYTKKTQVLSDERKAFETERQAWEPAKQFKDELESNPWVYQQIQKALQEFRSTGVLPLQEVLQDAQYGQYINHLWAENSKLQKQLTDASGKLGDLEFSSTMGSVITELKAEYGELITPEYEQELRDQAKAEGLKPELIKKMAKGDLAEKKLQQTNANTKKAAKEAEAKTVQKIQEQRKSLPPQPRSKGQRPAVEEPTTGKSWLDIARSSR